MIKKMNREKRHRMKLILKLFLIVEKLNIRTTTHEHPPLFTVEDSKKLRGDLGLHCKNLFLRAKKTEMWLVVCREDLKIDLKVLGQKLGGSRLSFGSSDRLLNFGCYAGFSISFRAHK